MGRWTDSYSEGQESIAILRNYNRSSCLGGELYSFLEEILFEGRPSGSQVRLLLSIPGLTLSSSLLLGKVENWGKHGSHLASLLFLQNKSPVLAIKQGLSIVSSFIFTSFLIVLGGNIKFNIHYFILCRTKPLAIAFCHKEDIIFSDSRMVGFIDVDRLEQVIWAGGREGTSAGSFFKKLAVKGSWQGKGNSWKQIWGQEKILLQIKYTCWYLHMVGKFQLRASGLNGSAM